VLTLRLEVYECELLATGITPRKSRLLRGLAAFGALFTVGFGLAYLRDAIDIAAGNGQPPMM
jgi:hypothetical protein